MWRPRSALSARAAGKPDLAQGLAHGAIAVAVARGVDVGFADRADIGAAAEETAEMAFLVAPGRDLDGALDVRIGIEHAGGFQRIDDAERPVEPAGIVLAFQMRAREQLWSGLVLVPSTLPMPSISAVSPASGSFCASHCSERICGSEKVGLCTPVL